jgi:hypothetical protein
VDGKPVQTWDEVLSACCGLNLLTVHGTLAIPTPGTYLLPGQIGSAKPILWVESPEDARKAIVANSGRVKMTLAYCSVYEECWEASLNPQQLEQPRVPKRKLALTFTVSKGWLDEFSGKE